MSSDSTTVRYVVESFTAGELNRLKKMVLGYGKFKATANQIGIPEVTLRSLINRGHGKPETINKVRTFLAG